MPNPEYIWGYRLTHTYTHTLPSPPLPPLLLHMVGTEGITFFDLTTLDCYKRHFREQYYIENYFFLLKSTKITKTTSQKYRRNIIWADFFWHPYRSNGIKTRLGLPATVYLGEWHNFEKRGG